jgi:hypothetical protein
MEKEIVAVMVRVPVGSTNAAFTDASASAHSASSA